MNKLREIKCLVLQEDSDILNVLDITVPGHNIHTEYVRITSAGHRAGNFASELL